MKMIIDKNVYITILCQALSPCNKYLVTGDIYGWISIFNIEKITTADAKAQQYRKPVHRFATKYPQVYCLASCERFLMAGGVGEVMGWEWSTIIDLAKGSGLNLIAVKQPDPAWVFFAPDQAKQEFNVLLYKDEDNLLFAACADAVIYVFNLSTGQCARTMTGHEDYIHDMSSQGTTLISGGEDGFVKTWDVRMKRCTLHLAPFTNEILNRYLGKWIGAVAFEDNWAVVGGGPRASLWHLRSSQSTSVYETKDNGIHTIDIYEGNGILIGGAMKSLSHFSLSGELVAEIPTSSPTVYSTCLRTQTPRLLTIAGSSPNVDVCTSFTYRDHVISVV